MVQQFESSPVLQQESSAQQASWILISVFIGTAYVVILMSINIDTHRYHASVRLWLPLPSDCANAAGSIAYVPMTLRQPSRRSPIRPGCRFSTS